MKTRARFKRRWFWLLCLITLLAAVCVGASLLTLIQASSIAVLRHRIDSYQYPLTALRMGIVCSILLAWPHLIRFLEHRGHISTDRSIVLSALRWRILVWLLAIELLVGQDLIWHFLKALSGGNI